MKILILTWVLGFCGFTYAGDYPRGGFETESKSWHVSSAINAGIDFEIMGIKCSEGAIEPNEDEMIKFVKHCSIDKLVDHEVNKSGPGTAEHTFYYNKKDIDVASQRPSAKAIPVSAEFFATIKKLKIEIHATCKKGKAASCLKAGLYGLRGKDLVMGQMEREP